MNCRFCASDLSFDFIDLHHSPASNSFLNEDQLNESETYFPLKLKVCTNCSLVQIDEYKKSEDIFDGNYVYFSSFSKSWLKHAENYVDMMIHRFGLNSDSLVIELASNDGYLLQYFVQNQVPVLGIEPTANTAKVAQDKGIPTLVKFFGQELALQLASSGRKPDLILGNNVLAHVPDISDFVLGMKTLLSLNGVITMEFPHLMNLVEYNQFDTIYHEHFSYLSLYTVQKIFQNHGLRIFDVEEIPTHGGSLRIFACHVDCNIHNEKLSVMELLSKELKLGMNSINYYLGFKESCIKVKLDFLKFLISQKEIGKRIAAYGAAAKGNTLLNYCGIKKDLISYVVDLNPNKQGKYLPGSHIPVVDEYFLKTDQPDILIILPWNLKEEILTQLEYCALWKCEFYIVIPELIKC